MHEDMPKPRSAALIAATLAAMMDSDVFKQQIAARRKSKAIQRNRLLDDRDMKLPNAAKAAEEAGAVCLAGQARLAAARAEVTAATKALSLELGNEYAKQYALRLLTEGVDLQAVRLADPRIHAVRVWLMNVDEAIRHRCRMIAISEVPNGWGQRNTVQIWNTEEIEKRRAVMLELLNNVGTLAKSKYLDPMPQLRHLHAAGLEQCQGIIDVNERPVLYLDELELLV